MRAFYVFKIVKMVPNHAKHHIFETLMLPLSQVSGGSHLEIMLYRTVILEKRGKIQRIQKFTKQRTPSKEFSCKLYKVFRSTFLRYTSR